MGADKWTRNKQNAINKDRGEDGKAARRSA